MYVTILNPNKLLPMAIFNKINDNSETVLIKNEVERYFLDRINN